MKTERLLLSSLLAGGVLALALRRSPKTTPARPPANEAPYDEIDAYVEEQMRRLNIPGVSLAIVEDDEIVHSRGFGRARPGGETPSPQTPFFIGSLTKSFTALAVMQLVEAGQIELDAPVRRYLPWFRVADPQASAEITVRHLLNQTSSLPMFPGMANLADFDSRPDAAERQARALSTLVLTRPVGSAVIYSNLNYNLLGLIIEATSGERYTDYIQHHIFDPLEMHHSYTSRSAARRDGLATGHRYWFGVPIPAPDLPIPSGSLASGQLISSAEDMAHYLIAHLNGGRYGDVRVVSEEGARELHRGEVEYIAMGISSGRYAMGWFDAGAGENRVVSHTGNVADFSGYMALLPAQKKGVVLLVNADHFGLPPILAEVGAGAAALLAGGQPSPIQLGFIPWTMRLLPLVPLLQIAGALHTGQLLRRWRREPALRPSRGRLWGEHIVLPMVPNLGLAAILAALLSRGMLRYLRLYMPDVAWISLICGGFAGTWAFLRTALMLRAPRKTR